jgi:hypothetical protein
MSKSNTPNYWRKTTTDAEIAFGEVFLNGIKCAAVLRNVDPTLSKSQYLAFLNSGKLKGGTVNRCPGVYQIECGTNPVDNIGFVVHAVDGDIVIGSPSGRVRIFGQTVDIVANGFDSKTGNVNIAASNNIFIDGKQIKGNGSSSVTLVTSGNLYLTASNNMYLTGAFVKCATGGILGGVNGLPRVLSNTGPTELIKTIEKLFKDLLG